AGGMNASWEEDGLKRLEPFKLDGVVQKITCPFLMLHGEGDEQIPLREAQKCFAAVGSRQKTMKIFSREEGGYHHCQIDNQSICSAYMWDWLEQVLEPGREIGSHHGRALPTRASWRGARHDE